MTRAATGRTAPGAVALSGLLSRRRWWRYERPFAHVVARDVFAPGVYADLADRFERILGRGLGQPGDATRFGRTMPNSSAYAWDFPPDLRDPLAIFLSREWHDLMATLFDVEATGDVNGALHHHPVASPDGFVHGDLGVGWFSSQPRPDAINPMDLSRCAYTSGWSAVPDLQTRDTIRAVTMIFYLANGPWTAGDGGETGLYGFKDAAVGDPDVAVAPIDNSLLVFENTPFSWHSFISNVRRPRNSVILWLHRRPADVERRWGISPPRSWNGARA